MTAFQFVTICAAGLCIGSAALLMKIIYELERLNDEEIEQMRRLTRHGRNHIRSSNQQ